MILHLLLIISGKPEAAQIKALKVMVMNTVEAVDVASFAMRVFKWADDFNIFLINYFLQSLIFYIFLDEPADFSNWKITALLLRSLIKIKLVCLCMPHGVSIIR